MSRMSLIADINRRFFVDQAILLFFHIRTLQHFFFQLVHPYFANTYYKYHKDTLVRALVDYVRSLHSKTAFVALFENVHEGGSFARIWSHLALRVSRSDFLRV